MKIYITSFIHDGNEYAGPEIHAESFDSANVIAEEQVQTVCGELTEILQEIIDEDFDNRVLH